MSNSKLRNVRNVEHPLVVGNDLKHEETKNVVNQKENENKPKELTDMNKQYSRKFDHFKLLDNSNTYWITEISVFSAKYVWGIEVKYLLDPKVITSYNKGSSKLNYLKFK